MSLKDNSVMFSDLQKINKQFPPKRNPNRSKLNKRRISSNDNQNSDKNNIYNLNFSNNNSKIENTNQKPIKNTDNINKKYIENNFITKSDINLPSDLNEIELNNSPYEYAFIYDNRSFFKYYISLLKSKHILIFSFYTNDYNSRAIKIILFFFCFALNLTVNALFFDDSNIHQIYDDEGDFNFVYQLPYIIYSSLIIIVCDALIRLLALFQDNILKIKKSNIENIEKIYGIEMTFIKIKIVLFFILLNLFLFAFWYYLSCFCSVYKNTQFHLIIDTLCSFFTSMIFPFILYLLPGIFRINSLRNKNRKYMYNFSKILQYI